MLNVSKDYAKSDSNLVNESEMEILRTENGNDSKNMNELSLLNMALSEGINLDSSNNTLQSFDLGAGTLLESMVSLSYNFR